MRSPIPILFLLLLLSAANCFAQSLADVKALPLPYDITPYLGQRSQRSVKKNVLISELDVNKPNRADTIAITEYDRQGRTLRSVSFLYGKRSSIANYTYPMAGVTIWRAQTPGSRSTTICKIVTMPSGKPDYFINWELMNADTTSRVWSRFFYDKDSLLVAKEDSRQGKPYLVTNYQYKDKRLVMAEFKTVNSPNTRWIGLVYNKEHLLQKQIQYGLRGSIVDSTTVGTYEYSGKNMSAETRPDGSDTKKMIRTIYTYDQQNRIVGLSTTLDTLYQKIIYEYKDKYLSRTTVSTNTGRSLAPGFYSPYINYSNKAPVTLVTTYNYDNKGYLIRTEETLNGVLQSRKQNVIEYY